MQVLWDAFFADHHERKGIQKHEGAGLELVEFLCVAMLMYVRADLLSKDNMGCLRRLMKYPPVVCASLTCAFLCRDAGLCAERSFPEGQI